MFKQIIYFIATLFGLLLWCWTDVYAQQPNFAGSYLKKQVTVDDGLSQSTNYFKFEDSKGFMWITGNEALNRFDGKNVKIYDKQSQFRNCKMLIQGYNFVEDEDANLYVGSIHGLYKYHRANDYFTCIKLFPNATDNEIVPIGIWKNKLWCFNKQWQLASIDIKTQQIKQETAIDLMPFNSLDIYITIGLSYQRMPLMDKHGNIWCFHDRSTIGYNIETKKLTTPLQNAIKKYKITEGISTSYYDSLQDKLILTIQNSILVHGIISQETVIISEIDLHRFERVDRVISYKNVWLICADGFLFFYDFQQNKLLSKLAYSVEFNYTNLLLFDKSGRLWTTHFGKGQLIYDFDELPSNKMPYGCRTFSELPNKNILINEYEFDPRTQSYSQSKNYDWTKVLGWSHMYDTLRKGIWFISEGAQKNEPLLYFYPQGAKQPTTYINKNELARLKDIKVYNKDYLLATLSSGLAWLNTSTHSFVPIKELPAQNPFYINPLSKNRFAISYIENDMVVMQLNEKRQVVSQQKILPLVQCYYLQEDTLRNRYWVGANEGVYLLDKNFNTLIHYNADNGFAGKKIYGILLDDKQNAWISHQHGMSSINATTLRPVNYDKNDGIQGWDYTNRAFLKTTDGTLFFGGMEGFNYFKPPLQFSSFYKPEVYLDEISINQKQYLPDTNANTIAQLWLNSKENNIIIRALVKDLGGKANEQLVYRLLPTDTSWKFLKNVSFIQFNSLASGNYTLELGVYDKYVQTNNLQKRIHIDIATIFYRTWWFWLLCSLALCGFVAYLYIRRTKQKHQKEIETFLHQQQLDEFELQALKAQINPHFMFNCLSSIKALIYQNELDKADLYLNKFSNLLRSTLNFSTQKQTSLADELEYIENYLMLEKLRFNEKFDYKINMDSTLITKHIQLPSMLLQPYIENAIVHGINHITSHKAHIDISIKKENEWLRITIKDNGIGRAEAKKYSKKQSANHKSMGMMLTQRRLDLHHIKMEIVDLTNEHNEALGTSVELKIPLDATN